MGTVPGFFLTASLGRTTLGPPDGETNIGGLNFALVAGEADSPVPYRFTTWGMAVESAILYQNLETSNQIIVGENGNLFRLDPEVAADEGVPITNRITTIPLPELSDQQGAVSRLLHEVVWVVGTDPPDGGYQVTITAIDADDTRNRAVRVVQQLDTKARVEIPLKARQFTITWDVTTNVDFDIILYMPIFQNRNRPIKGQTRIV